MKTAAIALGSLAILLMPAAGRAPSSAFKPSEYSEALAKAKETDKPIAIIITDTASNCPKCQRGNEEAFKRLRTNYVMVVEDQADEGDKLADDVKQKTYPIYNTKGKFMPIVAVFTPDGNSLLGGLCYVQISEDGRKAFRTLDEEIEQALTAIPEQKKEVAEPEEMEACKIATMENWTNSSGQSIRAKALSVTETSVTFELENGKKIDYPLAKLSEESRIAAKEACK